MKRLVVLTCLSLVLGRDLLGVEKLEHQVLTRKLSPMVQALVHRRADLALEWLRRNSPISVEDSERFLSTFFNSNKEEHLARYGKPQRARVICNRLVEGRFGKVVVLVEYDKSYLLIRFGYFLAPPDSLTIKGFSTDGDADLERLVDGGFDMGGPELPLTAPPEADPGDGASDF